MSNVDNITGSCSSNAGILSSSSNSSNRPNTDDKPPDYSDQPSVGVNLSFVDLENEAPITENNFSSPPQTPPPPYEAPPPYCARWSRNNQHVVTGASSIRGAELYRREFVRQRFSDTSEWKFTRNFIAACIVFWLCGFVFGAIALILAVKAKNSQDSWYSRTSFRLSIVGAIFGIFLLVIFITGYRKISYDVTWMPEIDNSTYQWEEVLPSPTPTPCVFPLNGTCFLYSSNTTFSQCASLDGHVVGVNNESLRVLCYHNVCKDYVADDRYCFQFRTTQLDPNGCREVGGYYVFRVPYGRFCYYNDCPGFTARNNKCYRFRTPSNAERCRHGFYDNGFCFHNDVDP